MYKVIVVDDEPSTREIIKRFGAWERLGMAVVGEAEDGAEALRLIERSAPQLLITDMRMPGVDGVMLMTAVKERHPDMRMIVISGYDEFGYARQALKHGALDYILKPVDAAELNAALEKCRTQLAEAAGEPLVIDLESALPAKTHKELIAAAFRDMSPERLDAQLDRLGAELADKRPSRQELRRLAGELLMLLKELMEENSLEIGELRQIAVPETLATGEQLASFLRGRFAVALDSLVRQRKFKTKLNLDEVRRHIDNRFQEPISLEELAKRFFVSKEYLSKAFRLEYGRNLTDYLLHLRMEKVRELLADERLPIRTAAEMAGYEDLSYFYRVFKRHFGASPGELRDGLKSSNRNG
ncbi:response regulator [Cohnella cellulosilytica]|uniref:Response regulator n=1 Tax=Cohnella cellulosilytica TaxID=986710 RepID=A0ABW2FHN8_9BACL